MLTRMDTLTLHVVVTRRLRARIFVATLLLRLVGVVLGAKVRIDRNGV